MNKNTYTKQNTENGFSLLELIVGLVISVILITALASNFFRYVSNYYTLKKEAKHYENLETLARIAERVMKDLDTHPLPLLPRIHQNGNIRLWNGDNLNLSNPDLESSAITSTRLKFDQILKTSSLEKSFSQLTGQACRIYKDINQPLGDLKQALLIHPEFVAEMITEFKAKVNKPNCYDLTLTPAMGMISDLQDLDHLKLAKHIIPIEWIRTYYKAADNQIRIVGHVGSQIIFNQPIYSASGAFQLEILTSTVNDHLQLALNYHAAGKKPVKIIFQHNVPRLSVLNTILNL